jgi:hypothetical protein
MSLMGENANASSAAEPAPDPTTAIPPAGQPWDGARVLYMMHPSDPIVWWSPHLIFSPPDWLTEPHGRWNTVLRPAGITSQDLADLRNIIAAGG